VSFPQAIPLLFTIGQVALGQAGGANGAPAQVPLGPWRPFIDPLDLHAMWWLMLLPLSLGIAVVYKAVRMRDLKPYWSQVALMTMQIVVGMAVLGAASYALVEVYAKWMIERVPR